MLLVSYPKLSLSVTTSSSYEHSKTSCLSHSNKVFVRMSHVSYFRASDATPMVHKRRRVCECFDLYKELVPYGEAWSWQKTLVQEKKVLVDRNEECPDTLIILQHHPIYTMGTGSSEEFLNFDIRNAPYDICRTERGGEVTYHGPGQLVMYPIMNLRHHKMDLHWYLRALEEVVIRVLRQAFSIKASRLEGFTGVWVGNQKLAAIGIRVSQWIAYHGLALNVTTDLAPFQHIVPCGIRNRQVGSIKKLVGETTDIDCCKLIDIAHRALVEEFSQVFQLELHQKPTHACWNSTSEIHQSNSVLAK